ncbi:hypothetical protein ACFV0O_19785 [Kitasatospora sp. NPDC059577]
MSGPDRAGSALVAAVAVADGDASDGPGGGPAAPLARSVVRAALGR